MVNFLQRKGMEVLQKKSEHILTQIIDLLKEIRESQDDTTLAIISIYNNQREIAKKYNINLPKPLTKMELEK